MFQDRWEGEDEGEIKNNWYDDDEPEPQQIKPVVKKQTLEDRIAEKKKLAKIKKNIKLKDKETVEMSNEEKLLDKLEKVKMQMESDLTIAKDTFGSNLKSDLDNIELNDKKDFDDFKKSLAFKLNSVSSSLYYSTFLEDLFRDLCESLDVDSLKKILSIVTALYNKKLTSHKNLNLKKKKSKGVSLKVEKSYNVHLDNLDDEICHEDDDFYNLQ